MKVVTTEQMGRIEQETDATGMTYDMMMDNAGEAAAREIQKRVNVAKKRILILIGPGNNGGDGLVAARHLHDAGADVHLYLWERHLTEDDRNFRLAQERNVSYLRMEDDRDFQRLRNELDQADILIDALLGTGLARPIDGTLEEVLEAVGASIQDRRESNSQPFVAAVDVPTGLYSDTGELDPVTMPADLTVTFGFPKIGQYRFPGAEALGELVVDDIEIPRDLADDVLLEVATPKMVRDLLPDRPLDAHKGTFGKALVVAGSVNYVGAPALVSAAATRVGAGLVTLAVPRSIHTALASKLTEVTYLLLPEDMGIVTPDAIKILSKEIEDYDALVIGPGLSRENETVEFVHELLLGAESEASPPIGFHLEIEAEKKNQETAAVTLPPVIIDADGLNALSEADEWWKMFEGDAVLTPHPGEMSRLWDISVADIQSNRIQVAQEAAEEWNQIVLLKGAFSLTASPDGRTVINPFANSGLATAGTGDVLAGAIVGLLAQGLEPFRAAVVGAYLHGSAGELVREEMGEVGMVAGDLLPQLPKAIRQLRER